MNFRKLSKKEEKSFRLWARDNWRKGMEIDQLWHPVIRDEIEKIISETA